MQETTPRLRDRLRLQTQTAILDAAEAVLVEDGLGVARIDAIAARAGVSVGTLYNHFADREALIEAVSHRNLQQILDALQAVEANPAPTTRDDLHGFLGCFEQHFRSHGPFIALMMNLGPEVPAGACKRDAFLAELRRVAQAIVDRGIARGELRADQPELLALALPALGRLFLIKALTATALQVELTPLIDLFLYGAAARAPGSTPHLFDRTERTQAGSPPSGEHA